MNTNFKVQLGCFGTSNEEVKAKILEERNAANTNKTTRTAMRCLHNYIQEKVRKTLEETNDLELPELLESFYADARKRDGKIYGTQTMKSMHSNLNRWFKEHRNIDIIEDVCFNRSNLMLEGMKVKAKKEGSRQHRSTPLITTDDLARLAKFTTSRLIMQSLPTQGFCRKM